MLTLYVTNKADFSAEDCNKIGMITQRCRSTLLGPARGKKVCYLYHDEQDKEANRAASQIQSALKFTTFIKKGLPV